MSTTIETTRGDTVSVFCGPLENGVRLVGLQLHRPGLGVLHALLTPPQARELAAELLQRIPWPPGQLGEP